MDQHDDPRRDRGAAADVADAFAGFGFDADAIDVDVQVLSDHFTHRIDVRCHLRTLGQDDAVQVADLHARVMHAADRFDQKVDTVAATIGGIIVGEQSSNVFRRDRSQQRIGDRVQQHIGIAVSDRVDFRRHVNAADPQRTAVAKPV